jgi:hypothetical protein
MVNLQQRMGAADPLFPAAGFLPLSDTGGTQRTIVHTPGGLRPFSTTLARPATADGKKHDTASTRNATTEATQYTDDSEVKPDSYSDTAMDS